MVVPRLRNEFEAAKPESLGDNLVWPYKIPIGIVGYAPVGSFSELEPGVADHSLNPPRRIHAVRFRQAHTTDPLLAARHRQYEPTTAP